MLKNKIDTVLNSIAAIKQVIYQDAPTANIELDYATYPVALMMLIVDSRVNMKGGNIREVADIDLFLLSPTDLDIDGNTLETTISAMRSIAIEFIIKSRESEYKLLDENINIKTVYDEYNANVSGVYLRFRAQEKQGTCITNI